MAKRPIIQIWDHVKVAKLRTLAPFISQNQRGEQISTMPEVINITAERVGCRACGCPLDRGTKVIKVMSLSTWSSSSKLKQTDYVHYDNCWGEGFVQTMQLGGELGTMRLRANNRTYDAFYDINKPELVIPNDSRLGGYSLDRGEPTHITLPIIFLKDTGIIGPPDLIREQERERKAKSQAKYKAKLAKDVKPKVKAFDATA